MKNKHHSNRKTVLLAALTVLFAAVSERVFAAETAAIGPHRLSLGFHQIEVEVADTAISRQHGLMQRTFLPKNQGMLFVFDVAARHCMWMKNTLIPLSVAFLDEDGTILNIATMVPESEQNHCAASPARYALEMNAGWFKTRAIAAGSVVSGVKHRQ